MFGFSIFLNQELSTETKDYIKTMAENGFSGIFTSLHIPEDDVTQYRKRLIDLGEVARENHLSVMVDISGDALKRAGFSFDRIAELEAAGITGLRMDYHISNQQIAKLSQEINVALNASTITEEDIAELKAANADFTHLEAWHNYYPRPETGLDKLWYQEKNEWLKSQGFTIQAFVPGNKNFRGPLYQGLPTLEEHRHIHPLAAALDLLADTDKVYLGDSGISERVLKQFSSYIKEKELLLHMDSLNEQSEWVLGKHINRQDDARDVIRSAEARFKKIPQVDALPAVERAIGAVTIDNEKYLRYMGEIQIVKQVLPADKKVNVVGHIIEADQALIKKISAGHKFSLERVDKND